MKTATVSIAPELEVTTWLNAHGPLSLAALRGKVVVVYAFQMLCPGCVSHSIPQAKKVAEIFASEDVVVLGLHTVFEHHEAMGEVALSAFIHEYRIKFPVGIDRPSANGTIPVTMAKYQMRGTPTLILIDGNGALRQQIFGAADDMQVGALISALVPEINGQPGCDGGVCRVCFQKKTFEVYRPLSQSSIVVTPLARCRL